jgi:hypothetical protein
MEPLQPIPKHDDATFPQFLGASILSAIGSLPQHIGPLIIIAIIAEGRISIADAGWVLSVRSFGELLASVVLPMIGILHLSRSISVGACACLLLGFAVATMTSIVAVMIGFFMIGACCGVMKFLGTIAASTYPHRTFAFVFRLALVLEVAGVTTCVLLLTKAFISFTTLLEWIMVILLPILVGGVLLYEPLAQNDLISNSEERRISLFGISGLLILYLFFAGISGFMAYAGQQASMRGMPVEDTILSIGVMKIVAGGWLLLAAYLVPTKRGKDIVVLEVCLLVVAVWGVFWSHGIIQFFVGFLLLEITLNGSSARLQSAIVSAAPKFSGRWLNGVILLGTASGPILYGLAIGAGIETSFVVSISVVIFLPLVWQKSSVRILGK